MKIQVVPVLLTWLFVAPPFALLFVVNTDLGGTSLLFLPTLIGFLAPYLRQRLFREPTGTFNYYGYAALAMVSTLALILVFGLDGAICIAMAVPLVVPLALVGAWIAKRVAPPHDGPSGVASVVLLTAVGFLSFDALKPPPALRPVQTALVIDAPPQRVWDSMLEFETADPPTDWLFRVGIAYPVDARVEGTGTDAVRYCNFSTGSFVEPITVWDEPQLLAFDVAAQPDPLVEQNPFHDIRPAHLETAFRSRRGQLRLEALSDGRTLLEGTTWYEVDMGPEFYWRWWSDAIVHRIHRRVLETVRERSEAGD